MAIARLATDTGFGASVVYAWSRKAGFAQVAPAKGLEGFNVSVRPDCYPFQRQGSWSSTFVIM